MATRTLESLYDPSLEIPLSSLLDDLLVHQLQPQGSVLNDVSSSASQRRGRGRPPKPKPDFQLNGQFPTDLNSVPVPVVIAEHVQVAKRPRGRPRKDGTVVMSQVVRQGSKQPGQRGRGRPRKSKPVSSLQRVSPVPGVIGEATVAVVAPAKRRGRPPKIGRVISISRTGRPRGRPRKDASPAAEVPTGGAADYGTLRRKYEFLREKVVEATNKLKAAVSAMEEVQVIAAVLNTD